MSKQIEAMKLALEALENVRQYDNENLYGLNDDIAAIREALAEQPAQQDSSWCMKMNGCKTKCEDCPDEIRKQPAQQEPVATLYGSLPVYDKPAQQDIPDLIAGALGVSRGTAYDMMREALAEASAQSTADKSELETVPAKGGLLPEQQERWAVFCGLCFKKWSVPYQHPGKSVCENCEITHGITKGNT